MIIRVDANRNIGMGHLLRCLAIAESLSARGAHLRFVMSKPSGEVEDLVTARGHDLRSVHSTGDVVRDAEQVAQFARATNNVVLVDGYTFTDRFERLLDLTGLRVAVFDDFGHGDHPDARVIINPNLHYAWADLYAGASRTELLLGPEFLPFRRELTSLRTTRSANAQVQSVLVSFGGGDIGGSLPQTLATLRAVLPAGVRIHVAPGLGSKPIPGESGRIESGFRGFSRIEGHENLPVIMSRVDMAISAGGMTAYELAFMGVPSILIPSTKIQAPVSRQLGRIGAAIDLGFEHPFPESQLVEAVRSLLSSSRERQSMIEKGQALFDGLGAERCAESLIRLSREPQATGA